VWLIQHLTVEVTNYTTGAVAATLLIGPPGALRIVAGTNQGQFDSLAGKVRLVRPSEQLAVTWKPTQVAGIIQGRLVADVVQGSLDVVGGNP
jgi:hypothetical protein